MPDRYALTEGALTALLFLSERERRTLLSAFDQLADDPKGLAEGVDRDWDGAPIYIVRYGRLMIGYRIDEEDAFVFVVVIRPR